MRLGSGSRVPWPSGRTCPNDAFPSPYPLWLGGSVRGRFKVLQWRFLDLVSERKMEGFGGGG